MTGEDEASLRRALALAREGLGRVAPNPSVGCVIVKSGAVVGEARTGDGGRQHAEEQALRQAGDAAQGATAYVTLEPCGERSSGAPSCAALLIEAGIARVVIAARDPHPRGRGLAALQAAGVATDIGLLSAEAEALNEGFFRLVSTGRPLLELSETGDGYDAELSLRPDETPLQALERAGAAGLTRVWVRAGSEAAALFAPLLRG
jgi:diaminohydroxyphosphoribosylaminopyrimidine deaminase/5-amino-6-(5-phosphoribosylamino)uracil reductase